jgi:type IV pilus assembly protein PilV
MNNNIQQITNKRYKRMSGLSLIEILVTVVVLSIGLLGIAGMQAFGMRYSHDSYARSQATMLANELIERMHANPDGVSNGDYKDAIDNVALDCSAVTNDPAHAANPAPDCTGASVCTVTELAQLDVFRNRCGQFLTGPGALVGGVENLLPGGVLAITCTDTSPGVAPACEGDTNRTITITWQDPDLKGTAATLQVQVNARFL